MVRKPLSIILFFVLLTPHILEASPSVDVPERHWSYEAIEKLAIIGLCDIADIGVRPVSRIKMAYIIKTAIEKARDYNKEFDWGVQERLEITLNKLISEFREELVAIGVEVASISDKGPEKNVFKIADSLKVEKAYAWLDKGDVLLQNSEGFRLADGFNTRASITGWARVSDLCAASLTPYFRYSKADTDYGLLNAHVRVNPFGKNIEVAYGRASMWWGPGFDGSLLLTDNAFPMDSLRVNNIYPFRLPWVFKHIGRFNAIYFVSRLEKNRVAPYTSVGGWRLDYTPLESLKFGFGHILMFGGEGFRKLGFTDFLDENFLLLNSAGGATETENHIVSGDVQLFLRRIDRFLPIATGAKLYTEWGGEDESKGFPTQPAHITGVYFTDVFKIPGFDLKAEAARLNKIWYTHFKYTTGYKRFGEFIGHYLGGDSEAVTLAAIFNSFEGYNFAATFSFRSRGLNQPLVETTDEVKLEFGLTNALKRYNIKDTNVNLFYEFQRIDNHNNASGSAKNNLIGAEVTRKF